MFIVFMRHKFLAVVMIGFLVLSIICQVVIGVLFQHMIKESDNMPATGNKLLKQCKLKYANYYKLNGRIINTSVFVDKFIRNIRYAGLSLKQLSHLSGQLMMLSVLTAGISVYLSLTAGDALFQIIPYYFISILELYLYFSISGIVDIQGKREMLKINLVDYLENHLAPRLETDQADSSVREEEAHRADTTRQKRESAREQAVPITLMYQDELEDLLKEFFA